MNYRQWKKKVYKKAMPHGFWKDYKAEERQFWAKVATPCFHIVRSKYPRRLRVKTLAKMGWH